MFKSRRRIFLDCYEIIILRSCKIVTSSSYYLAFFVSDVAAVVVTVDAVIGLWCLGCSRCHKGAHFNKIAPLCCHSSGSNKNTGRLQSDTH